MSANNTAIDDKKYLEPRDEGMYIVGKNWKYGWWNSEVDTVIKLWNEGHSLQTIAGRGNWKCRDVFILLMCLRENDKIKKRPGYAWGGDPN